MADPLDILTGRVSRESGDDMGSVLATLANTIASIPERRARAAQQRALLERTQLEGQNEQFKAQEAQRKVQDLQAIDQAWQSGNREEFLKRLPGHLQVSVQKGLADLDKADAERKEALEKARKVTDDSIARTLQFVAGTGYDPHMAQASISELKQRYKDDPQLLQQFGLVEKAIQENPTPEHVKFITDALIRRSGEQRKADEEAAKSKADIAHTEAVTLESKQKSEGTTPISPKDKAEIEAANARAAATLAETKNLHAQQAQHDAVMERIAAINAEANRTRANRPTGAKKDRGVTSGDANRLADLQTGLHDLESLGAKLGTTGAGSQIGAALPNFVTEFTGVGADSKSRQAVIDTVKQIIGKSLEGGVLRKEDEIKYEKILPRIGDPPDVAKSKIEGLKQVLGQKRTDLLSSLDDAGYDVSAYQARTPPAKDDSKKNPFRP